MHSVCILFDCPLQGGCPLSECPLSEVSLYLKCYIYILYICIFIILYVHDDLVADVIYSFLVHRYDLQNGLPRIDKEGNTNYNLDSKVATNI